MKRGSYINAMEAMEVGAAGRQLSRHVAFGINPRLWILITKQTSFILSNDWTEDEPSK